MEMNRIQVIILSVMKKMNAINPAVSISIANLQESIPFGKSYSTIYRCINVLCDNKYIALGVKDGKFNTYYITQNGINLLKEMI